MYIYIYKKYVQVIFFFGLVVSFLSFTDENFVPRTVEIYKSYRMLMMYMGLVEMVSTGSWGGLHLICAINGNSRNHQNANQTSPTTGRVLLVLYICNKIRTSIFSSTIQKFEICISLLCIYIIFHQLFMLFWLLLITNTYPLYHLLCITLYSTNHNLLYIDFTFLIK